MNDKELLNLAANAVDIELYWANTDEISPRKRPDLNTWNPLVDDGDAMRLAVKLNLLWKTNVHYTKYLDLVETDLCAATRRAIVKAAAENGKNND